MCNRTSMLLLVLPLLAGYVYSQSDINKDPAYPGLKLDLPLFDLPYQIDAMHAVGHGFFSSYANPSMSQSLAATTDFISAFHYGMKIFNDKVTINPKLKMVIYIGGSALGDFIFFYYLPLFGGEIWLHEEYHRAILTRCGINSFNGVYNFEIGRTATHVDDNDEIALKKESFADFARVYAAGMEGELLWIDTLQRNNFFYNQKLLNEIQYWLTTVQVVSYVNMNTITKKPADDFYTDYTVWAYTLFQPDDPLGERGYYAVDLSTDERDYLERQGYLQLLNFVSPMMIGFRVIPFGNTGFSGNFALRSYLTSFGSDITVNAFLKYQQFNIVFTYHNYQNYAHYFPAIEAGLVDFPLNFGKFGVYISPRILIGAQPENQKFKTVSPEFLGLVGLRVDFRVSKHFLPYIDFSAKTDGWVAGNEHLDAHASIRIGVSARFYGDIR